MHFVTLDEFFQLIDLKQMSHLNTKGSVRATSFGS